MSQSVESTKRKRAQRMTVDQVKSLIAARIQLKELFRTKGFDLKQAWRDIHELSGLTEFSIDQLKNKWNNLTKEYKKLINPPTGASTENGEETASSWVFFDVMHEYMSTLHTCYPPLVVNSNGDRIVNLHQERSSVNQADQEAGTDDDSNIEAEYLEGYDPQNIEPEEHLQNYTNISRAGSSIELSSPYSDTSGRHRRSKKRKLTQQDMFEFFIHESRRKKKQGKRYLSIVKALAAAQNVTIPESSSSSEEDF